MTSPLIARQKVFIATTDDNTSLNTYICAFDFHSGKQLWKFRTENSVKNTIACENGIVVAQDASCNLYALDAASGKPLWQQYINLKNYPYLTEGLTIDKGIVYAGIGAGLSAYDLKTGKVIWTNTDWKQREGSTTTLTIAGDVLISGTQWGEDYMATTSALANNSGNSPTTDSATEVLLRSTKTENYGSSPPKAFS